MQSALAVRWISKTFRVPRTEAVAGDDRRERVGRRELFHALRDVSFEVAAGQTIGLIGANGSGKTTLLKIMAGVMEPDAGEVETNGRIGALLELGAGFHPELSGVENVHLNGAVLGLDRRQTEECLANIIEFAELERFMDMPVKHFSSGMVVRLGFSVATQMRPDILLLDETFAVGDARFQARALGRIRELKSAGVTMVIVSHSAELILELADRVIWIDRGRIAMDGEPRRVLAAYRRQCGAFMIGAERVAARLMGEADALPVRPGGGRVRIVGAELAGEAGREFESTDLIELNLQLEMDAGIRLADFDLEALFRRDDRQVVAIGRVELPERITNGHGGRVDFGVQVGPIQLLKGEYEVILVIQERGFEGEGFIESRFQPGPVFRVKTPMPPDFDFAPTFRLVAGITGRWE